MKKVEVLVQRTFVKEATATVEVPSNLTNQEVREYLIERYDGSQALDQLFESFKLQNDQTTLVNVEEVEKEYKIKWEIDLSANTPEEAAKLALEMVQSADSTAKVFNVDGTDIDLDVVNNSETFERGNDEVRNIIRKATEPNEPVYNQIPKAVMDQVFLNGDVRGNIFTLLLNGNIEFFADYVVIKLVGYKAYLYLDKGAWRSEIVEGTEVTRGDYEGLYYIIDKV